MTSLNQYMKTSQFAEAHRSAAIAHGKLHRVISSELALRRDQRVNAMEFIKMIRSEQDRLQETSPSIPEVVINDFKRLFKENTHVEKPEIVGDLDHVSVNKSTKNEDYIISIQKSSGSGSGSNTATSSASFTITSPMRDHYSRSSEADQE
jgi:hypothetical protein